MTTPLPTSPLRRGLVLGSGGFTGVGWEAGVILGLADAGIDLSTADVIIGTSAGAVVGAHLAGPAGLATAVETLRATDAGRVPLGWRAVARHVAPRVIPGTPQRVGAGLGRLARRLGPSKGSEHMAALITASVEGLDWPESTDLRVTTLDADSGERRTLTRADGVGLATAVMASAAVPMLWPEVEIGGHRYVDAGSISTTHADLAAGCDRVVALTPWDSVAQSGWSLRTELALVGGPDQTCGVVADLAAKRAMGLNALDHAASLRAFEAGRRQGREVAARVGPVWAA